ncbi:Ni/Fe hydrogenase subunit alpha [Candidatus Hecatella orcuttiae]|jgi:F420-non-reducing hydrogenase large subunit|uniref:Ni/Fe hydrogenase subunit alpha n=1 Tax=Candidatus Hecatella orcuttiae TaxID=1935119 RepID=UPI002867F0CA|nr:Ni/Fe hydrogenase subunit alpha [Candidatus Hecatella orcuttiae]
MKTVTIDPITRLEGHGKISIFLDDRGNVANAYFQVPELRGFEKFCEGRFVEEMPDITARICGVCPEAHHMASTKTLDAVFNVEPSSAAKKLRELLYSAFYVYDHTTHFYILGGPDFVVGPEAPPEERNIFGVIRKVGVEAGKYVIKQRMDALEIVSMIGGRKVHPTFGVPGGISKPLKETERARIEEMAKEEVKFAQFSLKLFEDIVLKNKTYVDLITGDTYTHKTYYMGLVDDKNRVNFYDGKIRVVDPDGNEFVKFPASDYLNHLEERVEPWSYLKFPYLKKVGWKGFVDGKNSGVYRANTLARLNAADGMATPLAQEQYEKLYETLGGKPVHATLAFHWARLVELLYAAERLLELSQDSEITDPNVRRPITETPSEGVGVVEAPRGTLYHHYQTDERGIVQKVNLIVGTTNNHAAICMSIKKAAEGLIKNGEVSPGILNMVEMAFRAYDPCFACATHTLPGQMPLEVDIYDSRGKLKKRLTRF